MSYVNQLNWGVKNTGIDTEEETIEGLTKEIEEKAPYAGKTCEWRYLAAEGLTFWANGSSMEKNILSCCWASVVLAMELEKEMDERLE